MFSKTFIWFVFRENAAECVWNWEASMLPSLHLAVYLYSVHIWRQLLCLGPLTRLGSDEIARMLWIFQFNKYVQRARRLYQKVFDISTQWLNLLNVTAFIISQNYLIEWKILIWDNPFITYAKFYEKVTFLTPWYAHARKKC